MKYALTVTFTLVMSLLLLGAPAPLEKRDRQPNTQTLHGVWEVQWGGAWGYEFTLSANDYYESCYLTDQERRKGTWKGTWSPNESGDGMLVLTISESGNQINYTTFRIRLTGSIPRGVLHGQIPEASPFAGTKILMKRISR